MLRKITKHCLVQAKIFLEALVWKALSGNWNVAYKLYVVSVTFCYPYDNALKVSSDISYWKAICIALGKVFHCISLPELGFIKRSSLKTLSASHLLRFRAQVVLLCLCTFGLLWAVLGPARECESSSVSCGHLQVRLASLCDLPGLKGNKIKEHLPQVYTERRTGAMWLGIEIENRWE